MSKAKLDHILRAVAKHTGHDELVLVGSTSVIARGRNIPVDMMLTREADIYAPRAEDFEAMALSIKNGLGEGTAFHRANGYHADGVTPHTAWMPLDWRERTIPYESAGCPGVIALVPDLNDIGIAKMLAWRPKDVRWLAAGARASFLDSKTMHERIDRVAEYQLREVPRSEIERRLDEIERFTGRPGKGPRIHEILNEATSIGPGSEDGLVKITWNFRSAADDAERQATLLTYPAMAKDLAVRAWKLRDFDAGQEWEDSGRKASKGRTTVQIKGKGLEI